MTAPPPHPNLNVVTFFIDTFGGKKIVKRAVGNRGQADIPPDFGKLVNPVSPMGQIMADILLHICPSLPSYGPESHYLIVKHVLQ